MTTTAAPAPVPLRLPEIHLRYPHRHHPDRDGAEQHTRQWLAQWNLFTETAQRDNASHVFGHLGAYAYPLADQELLHLAADWMTWLYAFDDGDIDECEPSPTSVTTQIARLLGALEGGSAQTPLAGALADICARVARLGSASQAARFRDKVRGYLMGCLAEITYRAAGRSPRVEEYLPLRVQASGDLTCLVLAELASGSPELSAAQLHHPDVEALTLHAAYIIAMANDVFSLPREIANSPVDFIFNLPLVCSRAHTGNSALQAGLDQAAQLTNDRIRTFAELHEQAEPAADAATRAHLKSIRAWLQGTYDWMIDCGRYHPHWRQEDWPARTAPPFPAECSSL
ncbi:hypothetical protein Q3V23_00725 [Streptomyces sp. VNUA116]|uniref:terpene synthase family protein n=1 Tax=Streptomyces sp. VNUA116 TaxID=3062449 RepID=UPI00267566E9|nr:hypothetical protein [Streptomyces sp. VNUA116]WKU42710.1 hypothetical protein Q3V23_00725 [Streptomyces sp. VNUA116]